MKIWRRYTRMVFGGVGNFLGAQKNLSYWQDYLFAVLLTYLFPLSAIIVALSSSVLLADGRFLMAFCNIASLVVLGVIIFVPSIKTGIKKAIFVFLAYFLACALMYVMGSFGPGLIYLVCISVIWVIIFPKRVATYPVFINTGVLAAFYLLSRAGLLPVESPSEESVFSWIAVWFQIIFFTLVFTLIVSMMFANMQQNIQRQIMLRQMLDKKNRDLEASLKEVKMKNEELERFAFISSHDLQEPLRMIHSFMGRLKEKYGNCLDERGHKYIQFAEDGAIKMRQIILDLLEYSRIGAERETCEEVDLKDLIAETRMLYRSKFEETQAVLTSSQLPKIVFPKAALRQVFHNLISNSLKFGRAETPIQLHVSHTEFNNYWQFSLSDNGIGISEEYQDKVFAMFQKLGESNKSNGTGMGLAIVKKIIDKYEGQLWLESEEGAGSTFYFTIPKKTA